MIEQLGMRRRQAEETKVVHGRNDSSPEQMMPDPVHSHSRHKRAAKHFIREVLPATVKAVSGVSTRASLQEPSRHRFLRRAGVPANKQLFVDAVSFEHGRSEMRLPLHGLRQFGLVLRFEGWWLPVFHEQLAMLDEPVADFGPARFCLAVRFGGRTEQSVQRHGCHRAADRLAVRLGSRFERHVGFDELDQPTPRSRRQLGRRVLLNDHRDAALGIVGGRELQMEPMSAIAFQRVTDPMPLVRLVVFELTQQGPVQRADDDQV